MVMKNYKLEPCVKFYYHSLTDSKTLTEGSREKYFQAIDCCSYLGWIVEILSPNYISNLMLRRYTP